MKNDGKHLELRMHPPSIPTKYQTIHYDDSESKAFNSTAKRFQGQYYDDLPGPGYYAKAAEKLENSLSGTSTSKKGFGIGFASKTRRFVKPPTELETTLPTSPAQYDVRTPCYSYSLTHSLSPAFRSPLGSGNMNSESNTSGGRNISTNSSLYVRTRNGLKPTPAPGEYDPYIKGQFGRWIGGEDSGAEFVFKSQTRRSDVGAGGSIPGKDAPPLGAYDICKADRVIEKASPGAQAAFKSAPRKSLSNAPRGMPGPTSYNVISETPPKEKKTINRIKLGRITNPPARPTSPLTNQNAVPGSGATPIAFPSPGDYDLARGADSIHRSGPVTRSIFLSESPRFPNADVRKNPGPGYYNAIPDIKFRSFHLNVWNNWT